MRQAAWEVALPQSDISNDGFACPFEIERSLKTDPLARTLRSRPGAGGGWGKAFPSRERLVRVGFKAERNEPGFSSFQSFIPMQVPFKEGRGLAWGFETGVLAHAAHVAFGQVLRAAGFIAQAAAQFMCQQILRWRRN